MKVLVKIQFIIVLALVVVGVSAFAYSAVIKKSGVSVVSISNPDCQNIHVGDIITEVGGNQIKGIQDFASAKFLPKQFVSLVVNSGPGGCTALADGSVGIEVKEMRSSKIIFGVDLVGGMKYVLNTTSPANQMQNISSILKSRASYMGFTDVKIQIFGNDLGIVAGKDINVNKLLFRGVFEGNVEEGVALKNNAGNLLIGTNNYTVTKVGDNYLIGNETHSINDVFYLNGVKTEIVNKTNTSVIISLTVFNNSDNLGEIPGYSQMSFDKNTETYSYNTPIKLTTQAGKRFNEITQNIKTIVVGTQTSLDAVLVYKVDEIEISRLGMPTSLKGEELASIFVIATDKSQENLMAKKNILETTINAGMLPYPVSVLSSTEIEANQKNNMIPSIGVIVFSICAVPMIFAVKHKKLKESSLAVVIGAAEMFVIFSLFIAFQIFYKLTFALDFAAVLAVVLLSVNWAINIISFNLSKHSQKDIVIKIKYKKIISITGLTKFLLILISFVFAAYGFSSAAGILFIGIVFDFLVFRSFYRGIVS